jgi:hypothetical protein
MRLQDRLTKRCNGERGVFLSLTYNRNAYDTPRDLYRAASTEQHVAMFIRRLSRALGHKLTARWICKMEFQAGGWVHWHLIILGFTRIPHEIIASCWQHGYAWVSKLNPERIRYLAKYVAKGGSLPAFLYGEPPRSVKVVRTSPGFWSEPGKTRPPEHTRPKPVRLTAYRSIGEALASNDHTTTLECEGRYRTLRVPLHDVLASLHRSGGRVVKRTGKWLTVQGGALPGRPAEGGRRARLHLIKRQNPDTQALPTWLMQMLTEQLTDEPRPLEAHA